LISAITLAIVVCAGAGLLPMVNTVLIGAIAILLLGILTPAEARSALDIDTLVVIAASFGMGAAMESSGLAARAAQTIVGAFQFMGPQGVLLAMVLATVVVTELITNNAAAVLMFPIAMATAAQIGADPRPFVIALTVAASASFLTPIGYQTNTMVYGLGGYRFSDFWRLGLPLTILVVAAVTILVPVFWPF
jgi:di/tricarboxylate transporter